MDCKKKVGTGTIVYPCVIEIPDGRTAHDGPCKAVEVSSSVAARDRWEKGGEARAILGATQSQPLRFAEAHRAHSPTPVPGSTLQPEEYRAAHQPKVGDFGEQKGESCLHPFAALRAEADGSSFCQDCGTLLQPPKVTAAQAPAEAQSTLGTFVQQHEQTADIPSITLGGHPEQPTVEIGSYVLVALDEDRPSFVSLGRVESFLARPMGAMKVVLLDGESAWSCLPDSIMQVFPKETDPAILQQQFPASEARSISSLINKDTDDLIAREQVSAVPTKQRDGDQPLPAEGNRRPAVQDLIIAAMQESKAVGTERYGQPLKPMNGRDTFQDAQEEARDFYVYLTALIEERSEMLERAERAYASITDPGNPFRFPEQLVEDMRLLVLWLRGTPQT